MRSTEICIMLVGGFLGAVLLGGLNLDKTKSPTEVSIAEATLSIFDNKPTSEETPTAEPIRELNQNDSTSAVAE